MVPLKISVYLRLEYKPLRERPKIKSQSARDLRKDHSTLTWSSLKLWTRTSIKLLKQEIQELSPLAHTFLFTVIPVICIIIKNFLRGFLSNWIKNDPIQRHIWYVMVPNAGKALTKHWTTTLQNSPRLYNIIYVYIPNLPHLIPELWDEIMRTYPGLHRVLYDYIPTAWDVLKIIFAILSLKYPLLWRIRTTHWPRILQVLTNSQKYIIKALAFLIVYCLWVISLMLVMGTLAYTIELLIKAVNPTDHSI